MSKMPANWNEERAVRPTCSSFSILACAVVFLGIGGLGEVWAKTQIIKIKCPDEKTKKVALLPSTETVQIQVDVSNCYCGETAEIAKQNALSEPRRAGDTSFTFPEKAIAPGETIKQTLYCYTTEQVRAFRTFE